jgi:uracil-DNA glycosylase
VSAYEDGDKNSKIVVLGQAPGRTEIKYGRPLVGPSGEVFADCLSAAGLARKQLYIVNLWQQEVYTDKKGVIWDSFGGEKLWPGSHTNGFTELGWEMAQASLELIRSSGSNTIVPLGQQALAACTGISKTMMKWRGSPLIGSDHVGGRYVIPTIHPAATIHGVYLWRYLIISDFKKAKRQSTAKRSLAPDMQINIQPTLDELLNFMQESKRRGEVASDLEVINHQVSCFSLAVDIREAMVCPFMDDQGDMWTEDEEVQIWKAYADLMYDEEVKKVNQNIVGFDAPFLMLQNNIRVRGSIGDSMIAQHILYPEFRKGLDFISSIYTDHVYWKDEGKMWKNQGGDFPTFWRYNGKDAMAALENWRVLAAELTERDMWWTYDATVEMLPVLLFMTLDGLRVDKVALEATRVKIEAEIATLEAELRERTGEHYFNVKAPKQVAAFFYEHKGLPPYRNNNGGVTTDDKAMSRIFRKTQMREAKLTQELRARYKLKGTYLEIEFDEDGRLRSTWNPRGTWTGRLSSAQTIFGRGANMQNLDPRFKGFIQEDDA